MRKRNGISAQNGIWKEQSEAKLKNKILSLYRTQFNIKGTASRAASCLRTLKRRLLCDAEQARSLIDLERLLNTTSL